MNRVQLVRVILQETRPVQAQCAPLAQPAQKQCRCAQQRGRAIHGRVCAPELRLRGFGVPGLDPQYEIELTEQRMDLGDPTQFLQRFEGGHLLTHFAFDHDVAAYHAHVIGR